MQQVEAGHGDNDVSREDRGADLHRTDPRQLRQAVGFAADLFGKMTVRIILMPSPVDPEFTTTKDKSNILSGMGTGDWSKF